MLGLYILLAVHLYPVAAIPTTYETRPAKQTIIHANALPSATIDLPKTSARKPKSPNLVSIPVTHQIFQNLHVIPIQHHVHDFNNNYNHYIGDSKVTYINQNVHGNSTHTLIPVLIHNFVPVHELTVIPLHRVETKIYEDDRDRYRNPLGGYGVGWGFGGHGAGHGFHYAYG